MKQKTNVTSLPQKGAAKDSEEQSVVSSLSPREIVSELQGNDDVLESYIDYYFTINPIKRYVLSFRGEKEKSEFYEIGLKQQSVLSLKEIHEGENKNK